MRPAEAGAEELGGWLDGEGHFYTAPHYGHLRTARMLRETGDGPADPWNPAQSKWIMVRSDGEAVFLPYRYAQVQLDALCDLATHAPDGLYRANLLASMRKIRRMETGE